MHIQGFNRQLLSRIQQAIVVINTVDIFTEISIQSMIQKK